MDVVNAIISRELCSTQVPRKIDIILITSLLVPPPNHSHMVDTFTPFQFAINCLKCKPKINSEFRKNYDNIVSRKKVNSIGVTLDISRDADI